MTNVNYKAKHAKQLRRRKRRANGNQANPVAMANHLLYAQDNPTQELYMPKVLAEMLADSK